jgi:flagellar hook-basal body complex protein FliE
MIAPIAPITPITVPDAASISGASRKGGDFQSMLQSYVGRVQGTQDMAQHSVDSFLAGGTDELHSVALATQRAELEFEMFLQVRNKVVSAYQEVMKMQV